MLIATWNINSLKARINAVTKWIAQHKPEVLMLQEIKGVTNLLSPDYLPDLGYYSVHSLQPTYNGVCTVSLKPATIIHDKLPHLPNDHQARYLEVMIGEVRYINVYAPNGNPINTDKYTYKLSWLSALYNHISDLVSKNEKFILAGDFNIIPTPKDTYSEAAFKNDALYQLAPRQIYFKLLNLGLTDALDFCLPNLQAYTWWSYQRMGFEKNNGVRIDHILLSPTMADKLVSCHVDTQPRGDERPSDHAPVLCKLLG